MTQHLGPETRLTQEDGDLIVTALCHLAAPAGEVGLSRGVLNRIEFCVNGYCPVCDGWMVDKWRGATPGKHTPECELAAAIATLSPVPAGGGTSSDGSVEGHAGLDHAGTAREAPRSTTGRLASPAQVDAAGIKPGPSEALPAGDVVRALIERISKIDVTENLDGDRRVYITVNEAQRDLIVAALGEQYATAYNVAPYAKAYTDEEMSDPSENYLEDAAKAAFVKAQSVYRLDHDHFPLRYTWETTSESVREGWRGIAYTALEAAKTPPLGTRPLPCAQGEPVAWREAVVVVGRDEMQALHDLMTRSYSRDAAVAGIEQLGKWLASPPPPSGGWRLVPVEPDIRMMQAGYIAFMQAYKDQVYGEAIFDRAYRAALDAAPSPATGGE